MITDPEFNLVSQLSHFGWGLAVVLIANLWGYSTTAAWMWIIYCILKEFWYDAKYETPEVKGSSKLDFWVAVAGSMAALLLIYIAK